MRDLKVCWWPSTERTEYVPLDQISPRVGNTSTLSGGHAAASESAAQRPPTRTPLHPCSVPGCPTLTTNARCETHCHAHQREVDARRGTSAERGYDATWLPGSGWPNSPPIP